MTIAPPTACYSPPFFTILLQKTSSVSKTGLLVAQQRGVLFSLQSTKSCGQLSVKIVCFVALCDVTVLLHHRCFQHSERLL